MKKLSLLFAALLTATVMNLRAEEITSWTIAGNEALMGSKWNYSDANNEMKLVEGSYKLWKHNVYLTEGDYLYIAVANHTYGPKNVPAPDNTNTLSITAEKYNDGDYDITFTLDAAGTTLSAEYALATDETVNVTLNVNDPSMGSVSGGGTPYKGSIVTATATPNPGYKFVNWTGGKTSTDNPFLWMGTSNITLTANFAADVDPCLVDALPYEEDFDSYTAKTSAPRKQPDCWTTWYGGEDAVTASTAYCYIYAAAKKSGTNGFYMGSTTGNVAGTNPAKQALVALPAMNNLQTALLRFYAKASNVTGTRALKIGVAENNKPFADIMSSVVWIDSVENINNNWFYYTFDLSKYKGTGKHIVIMCYGGNTSAAALSTTAQCVYIDDLIVEEKPSCFQPIEPTYKSATSSSLTFSWNPQGDETQWDVVCVEKGAAIGETFTTVDTILATFSGLQDGTEYDFYVRANCGGGDVSKWSKVCTAQTLCKVAVEDAAWNFDNAATQVQSTLTTTTTYKEEQCWFYGNKMNNTYSYVPYINKNSYSSDVVTSKYAYSDSCAYKFYSTATFSGAYLVLPELIADLDTLQISFKGRAVYESYSPAAATRGQFTKYYNTYATGAYARSIKVGTVTNPYDMSTFEELKNHQFQEVTNANCSTQVAGDYWEDVTVSLYQAKGKYIVLLSDYKANNTVWIDNVVVGKDSGLKAPTKLKVNEQTITSNFAELTWISCANQFQIVLKDNKDFVLHTDTTTNMSFAWADLNPATDYVVEVKAMIGEALSNAATAAFTTAESVPAQIVVVYDMQGHGEAIENDTINSGEKVTEPAKPTAEGFEFVGWFKEAACENLFDFNQTITATQDSTMTLYASWTQKKAETYGRKLSAKGNYGTICLAKKFNATKGVEGLYVPYMVKDDSLYCEEMALDSVKAGYAYIFKSNADSVTFALEGNATMVPVEANYMKGWLANDYTLVATDVEAGGTFYGYYFMANNEITKPLAESQMLKNRAMIQLPGSAPSAPARGRLISFSLNDVNGTTGVVDVNANVNANRKVMMNGQLVIIRDGKMFNARGQEL